MRKIALSIYLTFCLLILLGSQLSAEESLKPFIGKVKATKVNIRSGAHINFQTLGRANKGEKLIVFGKVQDWYKVRLPQRFSLFISRKFVDLKSSFSGVVNAKRVNVRAKPTLKSSVLNQVNKGEILHIKRRKGDWLEISPLKKSFGWIRQDFIEVLGSFSPADERKAQELILKKRKLDERKIIAEKQKQTKKSKPLIETAEGIVEDSGRLLNKRSLHKLLGKNGEIIYFLDAEKGLLDSFGNCRVKVWGRILKLKDFSAPVIKVEKIIIKK